MCITLIRYYYYLSLVYCNTIYDSKQLIKHFFIDKQRVTAAPTGKYVCSKEMHLPRIYTEKRSKEEAFATDEHGIARNKNGKEGKNPGLTM